MQKPYLLVATRKGLVIYHFNGGEWQYQTTHFLAIPVSLAYIDERNGTWWACLDHGHWGVKLHRSTDKGTTWKEVLAPAYPEGAEVKENVPASTRYLWAMADGGANHPERLWIGTEPGGLFRSDDGGDSFQLVESLWQHPSRQQHWFGGGRDHPGIHSIVVDPRDNDHLYIGISCAGVFESRDAGANWAVRNDGLRADFLPDPYAEVGHDPHLLAISNQYPDIMWQQNHCGIFKSDDGGLKWQDVTDANGLAKFGFAIAVDEQNPDRAWVVPAVSDEMRVTLGYSLCVCRTDDGGKSWKTLRNGLPQKACFDIVYRHALIVQNQTLVFGTTTGNLFISNDGGAHWQTLNNYLPMVYALHFAAE